MLNTVSNHGTGDGDQPFDYLLGTHDHLGEERTEVTVLRGNPRLTAQLINSLTTKHRYTSGVVAWAPEDDPTPAEIEAVLDDIERTAFAGLKRDQYDWCCVLHRDAKGGVHVHYLIPRVELESGRAFNAFPPGWRKDFDALRDFWNHSKGWARPDDPARARDVQLGPMTPVAASQLRAGLDVEPDPRLSITDWLVARIEAGLVGDRADIVASLAELGEINREGADYISVRLSPGAKPIRLKGAVYVNTFNAEAFITHRAASSRSGTDPALARRPDAEAADAARRRLEEAVARRTAFNQKRFGAPSRRTRQASSKNADPDQAAAALARRSDGADVPAHRDRSGGLDDLSVRPGRPSAGRAGTSKRRTGHSAAGPTPATSTTQKEKVASDRTRNTDQKRLQRQRDRRGGDAAIARTAASSASTLGRAATLNRVRRLSSVPVVQISVGHSVLLQTDAPDHVEHPRAEPADRLRPAPPENRGEPGMSDDKLEFLNSPPPPRPDDDAALAALAAPVPAVPVAAPEAAAGDGDLTALELAERAAARDRHNAEVALVAELRSATKTQLSEARQLLRSELAAAGADAIARFVTRLTRLVLRIATAGAVVLPPSEAERRAFIARQTIEQIDGELRRRAEIAGAREVDAFKTKTTSTQDSAKSVQKLQVVRTHDPRQEIARARQLDAERENERNRS